jgi:hypothetical protein
MCAELVDELHAYKIAHLNHDTGVIDRARALLAQPVAEGPSADEWDALVVRAWDQYETVGYQGERFMYDSDFSNALDFMRRELARFGHPTPQPVAASERLPGDELCWWFEPDEDDGYGGMWTLLRIRGGTTRYTHWLPSSALPTPEATNDLHS